MDFDMFGQSKASLSIVKKKEAKFLPSSAKPQLPGAAQAGSMFLLSLTKSDIVHQNDKKNI